MKIGNINIGSKTKKSFFDMTHDVSTTSDFGFCQPTLVQAVMPRSSFAFSSHSFVRLAPMPCPTFGRIKVKQDCVYVPMKDVFTAFNEMQSGVVVNNPNAGKYVPQTADYLYTRDLFDQMIQLCYIPSNHMNTDTFKISSQWLYGQMFTMSISSTWNPIENKTEDVEIDYLDLYKRYSDRPTVVTSVLFQILSELGFEGDFTLQDYPIDGGQNFIPFHHQLGFSSDSSIPGIEFFRNGSNLINNLLHCFFSPEVIIKYNTGNLIDNRLGALYNAFSNMPEQFIRFFNAPRSSENADFSYNFVPDNIPWSDGGEVDWQENTLHSNSFRLNFHLTPFGKRLMKIFTACGWNFGITDFPCDMPKLLAYYKAWFDLYNIGRDSQWNDTNAFKLIHSFFDDPRPLRVKIYKTGNYSYNEKLTLYDFLRELSMCCYNLDADPITVSTYDPLLSKGLSTVPFAGVTYPIDRDFNQTVKSLPLSDYPAVSGYNMDSLSITFLSRLYEYVNKESAIANKIEDYMRVKYGVDIRSTAILKRFDFDCQISDIMGTVNNDQTSLGEYAGKGIGAGDSGTIKFDVPEQGFVIQMTTIVPYGGYVQANEKSQLVKEDFYMPEFDSMGNEEIRTSQVFARDSIINAYKSDGTFGFRPRYFSLKYKNNLNNGGFSFRSDRASFLPYCLDRLFTESHFLTTSVLPVGATLPTTKILPMKGITLYPDERLRSLGLVESYGNYNRIFYDTSGISDNFIIHMIQDFKYYAPMKPIAESYDTYDPEVDNNSQPIDHA